MQQAIKFLHSVLAEGPFYCTSNIGPGTSGRWRDTHHVALDSLVQQCFAACKQGYNTYYAMSAFNQSWYVNEKNKKVFRTQSNALRQKSLWLDIDCGKHDSPYNTAADAITALTDFLQKTHLPVPTVIGSGSGLHLYWSFFESIQTGQWVQLAGMLKNACVQFGYVADHSRTTDAASVLRIPGTMNYGKDGIARPVTILHQAESFSVLDIAEKLLKLTQNTPTTYSPTPLSLPAAQTAPAYLPKPPAGLNFAGMDTMFEGPKRHPARIIQECKQIQQSGTGTYTQWYNMMLVMKHCVFAEEVVHEISKLDTTRYDYDNVQSKLQQAIDGGYGPARCDTFNDKDPGICEQCPYWGKITSPLMLGETYVEQKPIDIPQANVYAENPNQVVSNDGPTIQIIPFNNKEFSVVPGRGIIWHKRQLVTGEGVDPDEENKHYVTKDILICETEVYIHSIFIDNTTRELKRSYLIRKQPQERAAEDIQFDIATDYGPATLAKWLATHGMAPVHPKYNKAMSDFMSTYLASIQNKLPEVYTRDHFGWVRNHDKVTGENYDGFIVGPHMYSARGTSQVKLNDRAADVATSFSHEGRLDHWLPIPQMYRLLNQPFPMLMVLNSFSAPFMKFGIGTATNIAYSIWDAKGGKGKSTILEVAASVWGHPKLLLQTKGDTPASRFQKFAVHKNLPIFIDEITNISGANLSDLTYDIVNGREKSRSTASGTGLTKSGTWATATMFTSNKSLYELLRGYRVQSDATCMRILEMQCDFQDYVGTPTGQYIQSIQKALEGNYGLAGPAFIQYCFQHPEVFNEIHYKSQEYANRFFKQSDERFWAYGVGIPLAVGDVVVRAGLLDYNIPWLADWIEEIMFPTIRSVVKSVAPTGSNLLSDYLYEHISSTLTVTAEKRDPSQVDPGTQSGLDTYVRGYPTKGLFIRHELRTNTYYVSVKHFQKWCNANNLSEEVVLQDLAKDGIWVRGDKISVNLGKAVSALSRSRSLSYKFRLVN